MSHWSRRAPIPNGRSNSPCAPAIRSIACLASQYAGWALSHGEGKGAFFALGSGPGRAFARKEPLFQDLGVSGSGDAGDAGARGRPAPPPEITEKVAAACGVGTEDVTFIFAPTQSLAGSVQVGLARPRSFAAQGARTEISAGAIVDGLGVAPLSPPHPNFVEAMGRTNDAIIYAGLTHLFVTGPADDAKAL